MRKMFLVLVAPLAATAAALAETTAALGTEDQAAVSPPPSIALGVKTFTVVDRAEDITVSASGKSGWLCSNRGETLVCKFDARTGEIVERFGEPTSWPQSLLVHRNTLLLVTDPRKEHGPMLTVYDTNGDATGHRSFELEDWRLYRVSSACLTSDGRWLWLASCPNWSSLYGRVRPAVVRIDVGDGTLRRVLGPPPDKFDEEPGVDLPSPLLVTSDDKGGVLVTDPSIPALMYFPQGEVEASRRVELDLAPKQAPPRIRRYLPLAAEDGGVVIDTQSWNVASRFTLPGVPTAVCVDSEGTAAYIAIAGSNDVLKIDCKTGRVVGQIDLSREGGRPGADARRGRDVHDVVALRWADHPDRLLALGYGGSVLIIATLEQENAGRFGMTLIALACAIPLSIAVVVIARTRRKETRPPLSRSRPSDKNSDSATDPHSSD
jgi:hypothetical protein